MNEKIESLSTEDTQALIEMCIAMTCALPDRNPEGFPNIEHAHKTLLKIVDWLIDKKFIE